MNPPSRPVKKLRIAATSILNINISAANLETFAETIVSWRRHIELEKKANKLNEVRLNLNSLPFLFFVSFVFYLITNISLLFLKKNFSFITKKRKNKKRKKEKTEEDKNE